MAKDRARPFSRKHRKYWFTVTGGMLLIGLLNVGIGMCAYKAPTRNPERIQLVLPPPGTPENAPPGTIGLGEIPAPVMRAFAVAYPRRIPAARKLTVRSETVYELSFTDAGKTTVASYRPDGRLLDAR
ncbi:MAG: hypothetical protein H0T46_37100 [Deltaproteobacteria bacterium]|nr:hypothetical protein [Deltaproteobacteria bacterium]